MVASKSSFSDSEISVALFAVVATILASNSLTVYQNPHTNIGRIFLIITVLWLYGGFIFLYRALRANMRLRLLVDAQMKKTAVFGVDRRITNSLGLSDSIEKGTYDYERAVIWFAAIAMILALNAIIMNFSKSMEELYGTLIAHIFEIVALIWLLGASFFLFMVSRYSRVLARLRNLHGIEKSTIEYVDAPDEGSELLYSEKLGLRGRPDYILKNNGNLVPVEAKTGRIPRGPLFSHILQLAAYCLLIEENYKKAPPYGIIKYSEVQHKIDYTDELRSTLISKLENMRKIQASGEAHRNHKRPAKCKGCSRREECPEKLV
jgi:CRISPR-associated exonuclease Cas4